MEQNQSPRRDDTDRQGDQLDPRVEQAQKLLWDWIGKQGHDACWYYPEVFNKLCELFGVDAKLPTNTLTIAQFRCGCERFQNEIFQCNCGHPSNYHDAAGCFAVQCTCRRLKA